MDKPIPEAVRQALRDAVRLLMAQGRDGLILADELNSYAPAIYSALTAAQQQGQAVACVQLNPMRGKDDPHKIAYLDADLPVGTNLYAQPMQQGGGEVVAWCALTPSGKIAYFDGKPMVMVGPVGNEHHTTPLYTAPPSAPVGVDEAAEDAAAIDKAWGRFKAAIAQQPAAVDDGAVFRLAVWMAKHDGHDDPHHLIWEGSPPEPWGEVWNRYEDDARAALTEALATQHQEPTT